MIFVSISNRFTNSSTSTPQLAHRDIAYSFCFRQKPFALSLVELLDHPGKKRSPAPDAEINYSSVHITSFLWIVPADKVPLHIRVVVVFMKNFDGLLAEREVERVGRFPTFPARHLVGARELHPIKVSFALCHCIESHFE